MYIHYFAKSFLNEHPPKRGHKQTPSFFTIFFFDSIIKKIPKKKQDIAADLAAGMEEPEVDAADLEDDLANAMDEEGEYVSVYMCFCGHASVCLCQFLYVYFCMCLL